MSTSVDSQTFLPSSSSGLVWVSHQNRQRNLLTGTYPHQHNERPTSCHSSVVAFLDENISTVQSSKFVDGIPLFMLRIYNNLHFETFHYGVKCYISSLSKNHINTVDTWSKIEEIIRYLNSKAFDHKKNNF